MIAGRLSHADFWMHDLTVGIKFSLQCRTERAFVTIKYFCWMLALNMTLQILHPCCLEITLTARNLLPFMFTACVFFQSLLTFGFIIAFVTCQYEIRMNSVHMFLKSVLVRKCFTASVTHVLYPFMFCLFVHHYFLLGFGGITTVLDIARIFHTFVYSRLMEVYSASGGEKAATDFTSKRLSDVQMLNFDV